MSKLISINPANYEILGEIDPSSEKEIVQKVGKAHVAKNRWKAVGLGERIKLLRKVVGMLKEHKNEFAKLTTQEIGMPITQSKSDVNDAIRYFSYYLDNAYKYLSPEIVYKKIK